MAKKDKAKVDKILVNDPRNYSKALLAVQRLIAFIGDDPSREGLKNTPQRVLDAWASDWGSSYKQGEPLLTMFNNDCALENGQMVLVKDIELHSMCEHHLAPFFGKAHIAYIPGPKGIVGLSKIVRVVDFFARKLQVQERLTHQISDYLVDNLAPDVAVVIQATHMCMVSRGVKQPNSTTQTAALRGAFYNDPATRSEFMASVK